MGAVGYDVEMRIFGKVAGDPEKIWELASSLAAEAKLGWSQDIAMNDFPGLFERAAEEKRALTVTRRGALDLFDAIRDECQAAGLSYVLTYGDPGAEGFVGGMTWHPGMTAEREFLLSGREPTLKAADVAKAAAKGIDAVKAMVESALNAQRAGRMEVEPGFAEAYLAHVRGDEPASPSI